MSELNQKRNRQAIRSIKLLEDSLLRLLENNIFSKITITEIAAESGLTRSTFYSHFESKDDLLNNILNSVIDRFFSQLYERDAENPDPNQDLDINKNFFRIWEKEKHLIKLLNSLDFECLLVGRIRKFWDEHYENRIKDFYSEIDPAYINYLNGFLSYTYVGFLKEWIQHDMQPSADIMGELLYHFSGPPILNGARNKFHKIFKMPSQQ